jgi:hypothetical protein
MMDLIASETVTSQCVFQIDANHGVSVHAKHRWPPQDKEVQMETETFRRWLAERGCTFEAGKDTAGTHGHAYVTVGLGSRKAVLPEGGTK